MAGQSIGGGLAFGHKENSKSKSPVAPFIKGSKSRTLFPLTATGFPLPLQ
jgi:hypothetical protein